MRFSQEISVFIQVFDRFRAAALGKNAPNRIRLRTKTQ